MSNYITVFSSYNAVYNGEYLPNWDAVVERLDKPVLLNITADDYAKLKKEDAKQALAMKFRNGGYEAGECPVARNPKTGTESPSRAKGVPKPNTYNVVAIDADDNVSPEFDALLENALKEIEYYAHATISSTQDKPRRRVLIPLAQPIDIDTREAVVRYIAQAVGIESIDRASVRPKQLMCLPVHTADGDKYHYHHKGTIMNATDWLPTGWQDVANWPKWAKEKEVKKQSRRIRTYIEEVGEWKPYPDKNKIHDAYNRTYRVSDILKRNGYTQMDATRWSHARHAAQGGIKVTNDSILYSYYGTDPLSVGRDLDAYEVALILEHGDIDDKKNWQAMLATASKDEAVKKTIKESLPADLPEDAENWAMMYDSTEEGLAQRAMAYFPHKMRAGKWLRYDNGIYTEVKPQAILPDAMQIIRIASLLQPDDQQLQSMVGKANVGKNVLALWTGLASQNQEDDNWEEYPWLLHFTDCLIDLKAYCENKPYIVEHSPKYRLTQTTGYSWAEVENYDPKALEEVVRYMELYLPDKEVRDYFQKSLGRCLTTVAAAEDKCVWLYGPEGGNGKSTILGALKGAMGSYYYELPGKYLYKSRSDRDAEAPTPALAGMRDKRIVNFIEYDGTKVLDPEKYKNFTSAGWFRCRKLGQDDSSFRSKACCFIDTNGMPGLDKREGGILRRSRFCSFTQKFTGDQKYKNKWLNDKKIHAAFMVYLLLGLRAWYESGKKLDDGIETTPNDVYITTKSWYQSFDDPADFFADYYLVTNKESDYLIADEAWEAYLGQVYDRGASRHAFRQAEERWLRAQGITKKAKRTINCYGLRRMCYIGVRLTGTETSEHESYGKWRHIDIVPIEEESGR